MNIPTTLKYTESHEWVKMTGDKSALIGLTDFAQDQLGDLVFVNLPEEGDEVAVEETFADVESVKAVSDIYSPVTGKVTKINETLIDEPEMINATPYDAWLIEVSDITEYADLMDAAAYTEHCNKERV